MKKVLFYTGNGLGDNIMLTPSLRKFAKDNPDTEIHIATLERFGQTSIDLFDGLGYTVHPILSDPWASNFAQGLIDNKNEAELFAANLGATTKECLTPRGHTDWKMHKIYRFSEHLGIKLHGDTFLTMLSVDVESVVKAINMAGMHQGIVVHLTPGNLAKVLPDSMLTKVRKICADYIEEGYSIVEIGSSMIEGATTVDLDDMKLTKALVGVAMKVIAIDSVVMHIAGALQKPLLSLWTNTPVHQALPFWMPLDELEVLYENTNLVCGDKWLEHREQAIKEIGC